MHGGAQNAHTFDTVALALQRPLVALDLPGHGHSDAVALRRLGTREPRDRRRARARAAAAGSVARSWACRSAGSSSLVVANERPDLVSSLVLIDITPGVNAEKAQATSPTSSTVRRPSTTSTRCSRRTIEHNPTRSVSSLRRGILHNALQRDDGTWVWRHQQHRPSQLAAPDVGDLWARLGELTMPVTLVRGMAAGSVVDDEDEAEFRGAAPTRDGARVAHAGHSIQGDQPLDARRAAEPVLCLGILAGGGGLEPPTYGFKVRRSAN